MESAAAIIGIADVTFKGVLALYEFIDKMNKAPAEVQKLKGQVLALNNALGSLKDLQIETSNDGVRDRLSRINLADTANSCGKECAELADKLAKWNAKGETHLLSRIQISFHDKAIQKYAATIESTKGTAQLAIAVVTLWVIIDKMPSGNDKDQKIKVEGQQIIELQKSAKTESEVIGGELQAYKKKDPDDLDNDEKEAIRNLEASQEVAERYWASCGIIAKEIKGHHEFNQTIGNVTSDENAEVWVGMPASVAEMVSSQRIGNVQSGKGAKVRVGIM